MNFLRRNDFTVIIVNCLNDTQRERAVETWIRIIFAVYLREDIKEKENLKESEIPPAFSLLEQLSQEGYHFFTFTPYMFNITSEKSEKDMFSILGKINKP